MENNLREKKLKSAFRQKVLKIALGIKEKLPFDKIKFFCPKLKIPIKKIILKNYEYLSDLIEI